MQSDHIQLSKLIAGVLAAEDLMRITEGNPDPLDEYKPEADSIAAAILREERDGARLNRSRLAPIVSAVFKHWFDQVILAKEADAIAGEILRWRLADLLHSTAAGVAAGPLGDGRATLTLSWLYDEFPGIELTPTKPTAAALMISIDFDRQITCMVAAHGFAHEVFSDDWTEIADEVRGLVQALVDGTYVEEAKDGRRHTTTKARWPGGHSSTLNITQGAGGWQTEWQVRAYDAY